ncbi:MAG: dihydroorotate dehydrogenase electron transfer subunit [Acidobacteria bacterium]|nr:MAG: dihydroorotate dehydrogenase electron transfer subunit [Acidobacteriota bacterium]
MAKYDLRARIVENECLGGKYYRIRAHAPEIASIARPGQFCMIRPEICGDALMRRPFSIAAIREMEVLEFAYTAIGRGTRLLAQQKRDDVLWCLGPLGNTFPMIEGARAICVAGGIGIAPFPFLNYALNKHRVFPVMYYGARTADELVYLEELNQLSEKLILCTDDGTAGFHGFVTQLLERDLENDFQNVVLYACGPHPMLAQVKRIATKLGIAAYLSMEEVMGCGIGICIGCPIPGTTPEGEKVNYLCCKDGPIFPSSYVEL